MLVETTEPTMASRSLDRPPLVLALIASSVAEVVVLDRLQVVYPTHKPAADPWEC